jgi:filamentous hemagglutinin family protein
MIVNKSKFLPVYLKKFVIFFSTILLTSTTLANPEGGTVVSGNATISQAPNSTVIQQNSQQTIIEWNSFNIGANQSTHFQQPVNGIALNRINSNQGMTQIYGQLSATGRIILVNAAGIYFGTGSVISVGGLIASTSNISNANFLAGKYIFDQPSPYHAGIINEGTIRAADYGLVALIGSSITNRGLIEAELGSVVLATGDKFTLDFYGDQLINFSVDAAATQGGRIVNTGTILADGGKILVTAEAAQGVLDNVIDMQGVAQARSVSEADGEIILAATTGEINISGKLTTSGYGNVAGGSIQISADKITLQPQAIISANGGTHGGNITLSANSAILISGDISAVGKSTGAIGGNITVAANTIQLTNGSTLNVSGNAGGGNVMFTGAAGLTATHVPATFIGTDAMSMVLADALNSGSGGNINLFSDSVSLSGVIRAAGLASGTVGGSIQVAANSFSAAGATLNVSGYAGGGSVVVTGQPAANGNPTAAVYINVDSATSILANALAVGSGGNIDLYADTVTVAGNLSATGDGVATVGGSIQIAANTFIATGATLNVSGGAAGGSVTVASTPGSQSKAAYIGIDGYSNILANANSNNGVAGNINLYADNVTLAGTLSAQGTGANSTGGNIGVYGSNLTLLPLAIINASATAKGGVVQIAAAKKVVIGATSTILAKATATNGFGGTISLSGYNAYVGGVLDTSAINSGSGGGVIKVSGNNIEIGQSALLNASGNQYGGEILLGSNPAGTLTTALLNIDAGSSLIAKAVGTSNKPVGGLIQVYAQITNVNGLLDASAATPASSGLGGEIEIFAQNTVNIGSLARVNALGDAGGGQVLIGGDLHGNGVDPNAQFTNIASGSVVDASAVTAGDGGSVVVWANNATNFSGTINARGGANSGNGGQVEVSGKTTLAYQGKVDLTAPNGSTGTLTLDPQNITIQNVGSTNQDPSNSVITVAQLESMLQTANVLILTSFTGNAPGDITVANNVTWDNSNKLTLSAYRNVNINASITNNAGGSLAVNADTTNTGVGTINFGENGNINMSGGGQVTLSYEPNNGNFRYPNTYADNVHVSDGTQVSFMPLNFVTPSDNNAIISNFSVLPNIYANISLALTQEPIEIVPADNGTVLALENNLEVITEATPSVGVRVMDQPAGSCTAAESCVSNDFVIE